MDQSDFDIAMKFISKEGDGTVWAESTLNKHPDDRLMLDFNPITSYDDYSNFFEVQSFDFNMTVESADAGGQGRGQHTAGARAGAPAIHAGPQHGAPPGRAGAGAGVAKVSADPFDRWRSVTEAEARKMRFKLAFESFHFTRVIDGASPVMFQYCCQQKQFKSAALVKRVSTGLTGGDKRQSLAFMRMDFKEIMLKSISWSDGDLVTETVEFVCNWLSYQYRQKNADGTLEPPTTLTVWDRKKDSERTLEEAS